jgi:flagellar protein FlaJ
MNRLNLKKPEMIAIISALVIVVVSFIFFKVNLIEDFTKPLLDKKMFYFILAISLIIGGFPFLINLVLESKRETDIEEMFLEFSRDLVEGVESGTPISKTILNLRTKNYGSLNLHVKKLSNQIELGIPLKDAFDVFSRDIKSDVIGRAITLIKEAERSGGEIEKILNSVAYSLNQTQVLKKERRAAISSLVMQGYIIFFIFLIIMLVMQFKILPIVSEIGQISTADSGTIGQDDTKPNANVVTPQQISNSFLYLILVQGFFIGIIVGKISEGKIKAGLKHSFILVAISIVVSSGANVFLS